MVGSSILTRPFTSQEASDAVVAICNLGLENWPAQWLSMNATALPASFLVDYDLIGVFQVGWKILYDQVSLDSAERLISVLTRIQSNDRDIQMGLDELRLELTKQWRAGTPWRARESLDVIAILDMPAWMILLSLIDECPVMHAGIAASLDPRTHAFSAADFEFISENIQIASVREFMQSLPETLRR